MESIRQCKEIRWFTKKIYMKHFVAFDVSMRKSTMGIYDRYRQCEFEGEDWTKKGLALLESKDSNPAISKDIVRFEQVRDYAKRIFDLKEKRPNS